MAQKRKAKEAFGQPQGQLSAVAAAKLARQRRTIQEPAVEENALAAEVATIPYDGHHSGASTPRLEPKNADSTEPPHSEPAVAAIPNLVGRIDHNIVKDEDSYLELRVKPGESSIFIGEFDLQVMDPDRIVTVLGTILSAKDGALRIYAPSTHALPPICAVNGPTTIRISSVESGIRKLARLSPKFRNIWSPNITDQSRSFHYLGTRADTSMELPPDSLQIEKRTEEVLRALSSKAFNTLPSSKPRIMAIGAKSSGKSTFNRLLSNHINSLSPEDRRKCLYLDLDPGQPEFTPAGQISLAEISAPILGPPFTHPAIPNGKPFKLIRAHAIAATSFKDDPEHYKACSADLIRHVNPKLPLIVNSCGWVTGLGAEVLLDLIPMLGITDIILLEPLDDSLISQILPNSSQPPRIIHRIPRHIPRPLSRTPAEARAMQTMAYFHHRPNIESPGQPLKWIGKPLSHIRPWVVNYTNANFAVMSYGQSPEPEFLAEVLNGSIVAIVVVDSDEPDTSTLFPSLKTSDSSVSLADIIQHTPESIPFIPPSSSTGTNTPLNPQTTHCVSLALIRSLDPSTKTIHLLTPLPEHQILALKDKMVILVRGAFDSPEWAYLEDLFYDPESAEQERPWVEVKEDGEGAAGGIESAVWRLRHPPMASNVNNVASGR